MDQDNIPRTDIAPPVGLEPDGVWLTQGCLGITHFTFIVLVQLGAFNHRILPEGPVHNTAQDLQFPAHVVMAAAAGVTFSAASCPITLGYTA